VKETVPDAVAYTKLFGVVGTMICCDSPGT
jgi:hypothetical protein